MSFYLLLLLIWFCFVFCFEIQLRLIQNFPKYFFLISQLKKWIIIWSQMHFRPMLFFHLRNKNFLLKNLNNGMSFWWQKKQASQDKAKWIKRNIPISVGVLHQIYPQLRRLATKGQPEELSSILTIEIFCTRC